jgi:glutamate dehydrogenase
MDSERRAEVLASAEEDVAARVLHNNYTQSLTVTLGEYRVRDRPEVFRQALTVLERSGLLDRKIEQLPSTEDMQERERIGVPVLTRPELAVLLAYSKLYLKGHLLESSLPGDPGLHALLREYFPASVVEAAGEDALKLHRLGAHIACTRLTNLAVDTLGGASIVHLINDTGKSPARVAKAWYVAYAASSAHQTIAKIHALDLQVPAGVQAQWLLKVGGALDRATRWLLANEDLGAAIGTLVERYCDSVGILAGSLLDHLSERKRREVQQRITMYQTDGMSRGLARELVALEYVDGLLPVAALARNEDLPASQVGRVYFGLAGTIDFPWLQDRLNDASSGGAWELRAAQSLALDLESIRTKIVRQLLSTPDAGSEAGIEAFRTRCGDRLSRIGALIDELRDGGAPGIPALVVAIHAIREECAAWGTESEGSED